MTNSKKSAMRDIKHYKTVEALPFKLPIIEIDPFNNYTHDNYRTESLNQKPKVKGINQSSQRRHISGDFPSLTINSKCDVKQQIVKESQHQVNDDDTKHKKFHRVSANGELVLRTGNRKHCIPPGQYRLQELFKHLKLPSILPKRTVIYNAKWISSEITGKSGKLVFPRTFNGSIAAELATNATLLFYNCSFINSFTDSSVSIAEDCVMQNFYYSQNYLDNYVKAKRLAGLERHSFPHIEYPLEEINRSGYMVLGKFGKSGKALYMTAFKVPRHHTLYIPAGVIHTNDYMLGKWRIMLSERLGADHVCLYKEGVKNNRELEHFSFTFT